jgi:hypothetical protein
MLVLREIQLPVTLHEVLAGIEDIEDAIYESPAGVKVVPLPVADRVILRGYPRALIDGRYAQDQDPLQGHWGTLPPFFCRSAYDKIHK